MNIKELTEMRKAISVLYKSMQELEQHFHENDPCPEAFDARVTLIKKAAVPLLLKLSAFYQWQWAISRKPVEQTQYQIISKILSCRFLFDTEYPLVQMANAHDKLRSLLGVSEKELPLVFQALIDTDTHWKYLVGQIPHRNPFISSFSHQHGVTETDTWYDDDMDEDDFNYTDLDEVLDTLIPLPEDATPVNPATFDEQWEEYLSNMNPKHHEWMNGWSQKTKENRLRWFRSAKERGVRFINRDQSE